MINSCFVYTASVLFQYILLVMYVCACICGCVHVRLCVHVYMYVCVCVHLCVCVFVHPSPCVCMSILYWCNVPCVCVHRLEENYELQDGICLPRNTIYSHYLDFCSRIGYSPINAASFGKV